MLKARNEHVKVIFTGAVVVVKSVLPFNSDDPLKPTVFSVQFVFETNKKSTTGRPIF